MNKTIDILRNIVSRKAAEALLFVPPAIPIPEGMDEVCRVYDLWEDDPEYVAYCKDRLFVDMQTANVVVTVYDAINPKNQAKVDRMLLRKTGFLKVVEIAWKAVA